LIPPRLELEIKELQGTFDLSVTEMPDYLHVEVCNFPTSSLFNKPATTVLLRVPKMYPDAGLDMFWTDEDLLLAGGAQPQASEVLETFYGKRWRRFSWHHSKWNPNVDTLFNYLGFVRRRFDSR